MQDVKTIYLIDNGTSDNYQHIIEKYKNKIRLFIRNERYQQEQHYNSVYGEILIETYPKSLNFSLL